MFRFTLRCSPCIICISTWHWLFCDPAGASNQTDDTHPRPLLLTLDSSLQPELQVELRDLAEQHPGLSVLTISKRKSWAVYATHSDISKSLQRPFRKVEHIVPTVRKWLAQATVPSHHTIVPANQIAPDASQAEADHSSVASTLTASFLDANPELGELSIVEVDGVVMVTATHEDTLYTMERCYSSWDLARRDLIRWIHKLERCNITATAPSRDYGLRDNGLRESAPNSYSDCVRPSALGRQGGTGRPSKGAFEQHKTAPYGEQLNRILSQKCDRLTSELARAKAELTQEKRKHQHAKAVIADQVLPDKCQVDGRGFKGKKLFSILGSGYTPTDLKKTIYNHVSKIMDDIQSLVKDDALKAMQLADRVQQRTRGQLPSSADRHQLEETNDLDPRYVQLCVQTFESLKQFLKDLQGTYKTKAPSGVKSIMQTVVTAVMSNFDPDLQSYLAQHLDLNSQWLDNGKVRAMTFYEEGLIDQIADTAQKLRKDRIPALWRYFCRQHWIDNCRPGEKMRDKLKNPKDRSDKEVYTIHFREKLIKDLYTDCLVKGKEKWPVLDPNDGDGEDVVRLKEGFQLSDRVYRDEKPFFIREARRDQCLCIWHLRFEYLAEGFYNFWQARRTAVGTKCDCPHLKTGTALRRHLICPRPEDADLSGLKCVRQACRNCRDIKRLNVCDKCIAAFKGHKMEYQIFGQREFTRKKGKAAVDPDFVLNEKRQAGSVETKPDFVLVESSYEDFLDYLGEYWPIYIAHHEQAKAQDYDWDRQRKHFPRSTWVSTQDYSENYHHEARKEFQSAYFVEIGSTVYGMVIRVHLEDIANEAEMAARGEDAVISDAHRVELMELFSKLDEPAIVTISLIVMSSDLVHDEAFVQHCNDKIMIPYMQKIKANGVEWRRHHARSDGCKKQYKDGTQFLWISTHFERHGIHLEWNFFCSCHGKDISDPECGTCKICARQREMEHTELKPTRIRTALELKDFCEGKLTWPQKKLTQKQGKGIFKRQFFYVPASGVGAANRRIRKGKTLKGSSRLHVIADIGIAGKLKIRERGCHQPGCPCWIGMYEQCAHIPREGSLGLAEASHPLLSHTVPIEKDGNAEHIIPMTRNYLCNRGIELSELVELGDIVAVYLEDVTEPWMLGKVLKVRYEITQVDAEYTWMGQMEAGDWVVLVQKLEPTAGGLTSSFFMLKDKVFPCWVEDLRVIKIKLKEYTTERRSTRFTEPVNPLNIRYEITPTERERVLVTLPLVMSLNEEENRDKHKHKRREAEFDDKVDE